MSQSNLATSHPVPITGKGLNKVLVFAGILLLISLSAWGFQLREGLIVTDLNNSFSWGLYIATFAFFVGIAAGGLIVSSSVYLFNLENLKPFTKIASLSAFACTLGAGAMILPDMGRVDRVYNMLLHPNFASPLVWDMIVITAYIVVTFLSVYMQLLPDWKREKRGLLNGWTKKYSLEEIQAFSKKWSRRVAIIGLPFAVLIHTVTALLFATQASRSYWNTASLPPDFIAAAVASGTALVMVISILAVGKDRFNQYQDAFRTLATIVAGALVVHFFLISIDLIIHGWWGGAEGAELFHILFGRYGFLYGIEILLPAFTMIFFFTSKGKSSRNALLFGSLLLFIGIFAHRLMLMYPSFNMIPLSMHVNGVDIGNWAYPVATGEFQEGVSPFTSFWPYKPTGLELALTLLPFGIVMFVVSFVMKLYPLLPSNEGYKEQ